MSATRETWPQPRVRLSERPRAIAAVAALAVILLAAGLGAGLAIGGTSPARRDHQAEHRLRELAQRSATQAGAAQAQAAALRARYRRLGARATVLQRRKDYWKRRYTSLRRRR